MEEIQSPKDIDVKKDNDTAFKDDALPAKYHLGIIAGLISAAVIGALVAGISCLFESVFYLITAIAATIIGFVVQIASNRNDFFSVIISIVCGAIAVYVFTVIVESQGYVLDDGSSISDNMYLYMAIAGALSGWATSRDI